MIKKIVLALSLLYTTGVFSQIPVKPIDTLSFARFDRNEISFNPDSSLLCNFFAKFDSVVTTGEGNVNIVQIGGSHVQAGTFPHQIRRNLLIAFPEMIGRRGMIFPYAVAPKCNNPIDYKVSSTQEFSLIRNVYKEIEKPLGVTGIAVYTKDSIAEIQITMREPEICFEIERVYLFGFSDSGNVVPSIIVDTVEYLPVEIDTHLRRYIYETNSFADTFTIRIHNDTAGIFTITGIFLDNSRHGITYHSLGVNGASVSSFLKCDYFIPDLELLQPDLVIFGLGINDAAADLFDTVEFVNNYLLLTEKVRAVNPECAFLFVTNNDSYKKVSRGKYAVNQRGPIVQKQFHKLASLTGGAVWDQFEIMGGLKSMDKWREEKLAKNDRVHFTNAGYQLLGDLFFNAFLDAQKRCEEYRTIKIEQYK